ncbi:MAG: bifunctional glycosyltransferase family 2/GtrA family protein [Methylococcales bacterium]
MSYIILIPAYKPDSKLIVLLEQLTDLNAVQIVLVNDGSGEQYNDIFAQATAIPNCEVLIHAINQGKGRALKTGINWILTKYSEMDGIVTADADGQHSPEDIMAVVQTMTTHPKALILGCRQFDGAIPLRSRLGNSMTRLVFRLLAGVKISDTQTGLRGIPRIFLASSILMEGERYEYEINMLLTAVREKISIVEIPIRTIYLDDNASSHFSPIFDSFKIYFVLFRFFLSSLTTSVIDYIVFIISLSYGFDIALATIFARLLAGSYNYLVNKNIVFKDKDSAINSFIKYWILVMILGTISFLCITWLSTLTNIPISAAKIIVETLLFLASFVLQRDVVFSRSKEND